MMGWVHVGCLTGLCLTIQIKEKLFDENLGCSTQIMFDRKLTIVEHKINETKSEMWLYSINSYFNFENWQLLNITLIQLI